jgi:flagellar capping protein FliD
MTLEAIEARVNAAEKKMSLVISGANQNRKVIARGFEDVRRDIGHIQEDVRGLDDRFDAVDAALVSINERIAAVEEHIEEGFAFQAKQTKSLRTQMDDRFTLVDHRFSKIEQMLQQLLDK